MTQIQIGDVVKSMDFPGVDDCYMVGRVVSFSRMDGTFRAEFMSRVWQGVVDRKFKTDYFVAPVPGNFMFDEKYPNRITVVNA